MRVARIAAVRASARSRSLLAIPAQKLNIAFLVALAFAVAASANLPSLLYNLFWKRFNTRGAVWAIYGGLITCVGWCSSRRSSPARSRRPANRRCSPTHRLPGSRWSNPGIISIPLGFLFGWLGTVTSREPEAEERYTELEVRSLTGAGVGGGGPRTESDTRHRPGGPSGQGRPDRHCRGDRLASSMTLRPECTPESTRSSRAMSRRETLSNLLQRGRRFEPPADLADERQRQGGGLRRAADADRSAFWAEQAERLDWAQPWDRSSTGRTRRSRSGSSAASSTRRTTASTGTSRTATATGSPSTGSASPRTTPATSPTPSSRTRSARPPTRWSSSASRRATGSRSTCR